MLKYKDIALVANLFSKFELLAKMSLFCAILVIYIYTHRLADIYKYHLWISKLLRTFFEKVNFLQTKDTRNLLFAVENYTIKMDIISGYFLTNSKGGKFCNQK